MTPRGTEVSNAGRCAAWTGRAAASLLSLALLAAVSGCDDRDPLAGRRPIRIDFRNVAHGGHPSSTALPPLRFAIAAMISPQQTHRYYVDFVNLVAEKVGRKADLVQRKTYAEINDLLRQGDLDLALVCSGPYVQGHERFGLEILAVPMVHGETTYRSFLIVNRLSPFHSLKDLKGKAFAFTDPDSNTGCLVPTILLRRMGQTPDTFFSKTFYTYSHDNSIKAVADRLADGAAVDSLIWQFLEAVQPELTSRARILATSEPFGIPPVVVAPSIDPALRKALRAVLLTLHEDPRGVRLLGKLRIDRFVPGDDRDYESIRSLETSLAESRRRPP